MIQNAFIASNGLIVNGNAEINGDLTVSGFAYASSSYAITASYALNFSGTSGINGTDGTSGTSGQNGTSGTGGNSGTDGTSGSSGESGTSGTNGLSGTSGTSGESGTSGTTGTSGTSGATGSSGQSGSDGTSGTSGTSGVSGATGSSGTSGTDGTSGSSGSTGISGTSGTSGATGSSGQSGSDGTSGTSGTNGASGTSGINGTSGSSGTSGTSGETGTSGTSGATGSSGTSGTDGISGTTGASGTSGSSGTSGATGSSGTSGATGASGSSGTSGATGASGSSGTSGVTGASGTSGSSGTSGATGASGSSGTSGTSGSSGTSGTSGSSGTSGATGASGSSGTSGVTGASGTSGSSGTSGTSGSSGTSGASGSSGTSGTSGSSGTSGAGTISGGTANYVARFTGATTLTTGSIFDNATNVGIGKATPNANLDVYGDTIITGSLSVTGNITNIGNVSANSITVAGQPTTYGTVNPDYINAGRITSDQTGAGSGSDIIFNYAPVSSGISLNTSTGVFTLTAGKTYSLFAELSFSNFSDTANGYEIYDWVDATTNTRLVTTGIGAGIGENINRNTNEFNATSTTLIYTPTTNQTVKVRIVEAAGTVTVRAGIGTKAIIQQINPVIAVQATATGTVSTNYAKYTRSAQQTGLSNGSVVVCNVIENTGGSAISVNTGSGQVTLAAGKTYRLKGMIPGFTTSGANVRPQFCWYNETTLTYIGSSAESYSPSDAVGYGAFGGAAEAIITTAATTVTSFRLLAGATNLAGIGGNTDFSTTGSYPWIDIQEIGATFALNALDTMTLTGAVSASGNVTGQNLISSNASGNEGGEIQLAKSPNSTLSGSNVVIDQYIDRIRFFESGGSSRGAYIDLSTAPAGVGFLINNRASGIVDAGTDVTLGNLKVRLSTSGNRSLQVSTVSGTYSVYGSSVYSTGGPGGTSITDNAPLTITTTPTYINAAYSFGLGGYTDTWLLMSTASNIAWRITLIVGSSYNNNMICIERLV